jgi:glyoxylase-like metal-dependent hydrolase (beta-lactamase superfamily II)
MELKKINERVFYIPNAANIGVVKCENNSAVLIDSGIDDDAAKKILRLLEDNGLSVEAVVNTHSHADHCGGNNYLKEKKNIKIYAPEGEAGIIQSTILEPLYFFSGAHPPKELQNKFLMAKPSKVDYVIARNERELKFDDLTFNVLQLPGHSPYQIGLVVDNILFCADSVFSEEILEKHKIPFFTDITKARETLMSLREAKYAYYVPSHAQPRESLIDLIDANLKAIDGIENFLINNITQSKTTEQILKETLDHYGLNLNGMQQYHLMKTAVLAYLSAMNEKNSLKYEIKNNLLFWELLRK